MTADPTVQAIARAKAEALRQAAREMRVGWGDIVNIGYYGAIHIPDDDPSKRLPLGDWLMARADDIEAGR